MKKIVLLFSAIGMIHLGVQAQPKQTAPAKATATPAVTAPSRPPATKAEVRPTDRVATPVTGTPNSQPATNTQNADLSMKFSKEEHNFGTVPEGPAVTTDFEFKNIGKEPIILSNVQASCGCTTPSWTKEPVLPGKTGKISATYNTQGRPGQVTKTVTVQSNVGSKVLKIVVNVEKAPDSSVPANDNSMMKH
jgi:hypothetical protein